MKLETCLFCNGRVVFLVLKACLGSGYGFDALNTLGRPLLVLTSEEVHLMWALHLNP